MLIFSQSLPRTLSGLSYWNGRVVFPEAKSVNFCSFLERVIKMLNPGKVCPWYSSVDSTGLLHGQLRLTHSQRSLEAVSVSLLEPRAHHCLSTNTYSCFIGVLWQRGVQEPDIKVLASCCQCLGIGSDTVRCFLAKSLTLGRSTGLF